MKLSLIWQQILLPILFICTSPFLTTTEAQGFKLTGKITAENGDPLVGATIQIEELSIGTTSDIAGQYLIEIPVNQADGSIHSLIVRYVGFISSTFSIPITPGSTELNFILRTNVLALGGVEVTALKAGATLVTETPVSITAFKGSLIESMNANSISDFIQNAPGVTSTQLDEGYMNLQIRGISSLSGDSPAGYYLDDIPFTFVGSPLIPEVNPFDLDRVEVLRGPQGTLYGNGGQSGVLRVITHNADPTRVSFKADLMGATTKGGGSNYGAQGVLNLPVVKDKLGIRLIGGHRELGGFLTNNLLGKENINKSKMSYFRGKVNYRPSDALSIKGSIWTQNNDVGTYTLADDNYDHSTPFDETNTNNFIIYNGTIEYKFPKLTLYSSTSYTDLEARIYDGSPIFARSDTDLSQTAFNEEIRLSSKNDGAFDWLAGFYYWSGTTDQLTSITFLLPDNTMFSNPFLSSISTSTQIAGYGELYYRFLNNKMRATVGLRYFSEDRGLEDQLQPTKDLLSLLGLDAKRSTNYNVVSPRFNLSYNPDKNALVYATVSKGFRSGLVQNGSFLTSGLAFGVPVPEFVNEENLWSYEFGSKIFSADKQFLIEGAVYYNDWSDLIQTSSELVDVQGVPTPIIFFTNAGKASALGLDINTQYSTSNGLTLSLGGNINKSIYKDDTPSTIGAKDGDRISFVPKMTFNTSAYYVHSVLSNKLNGSIFINLQHNTKRIDYRVGEIVSGDANTMLNAKIGVEGKTMGVFLYANNLLNERGATFPHNLLTYDNRLRPQTFGINLRFNY